MHAREGVCAYLWLTATPQTAVEGTNSCVAITEPRLDHVLVALLSGTDISKCDHSELAVAAASEKNPRLDVPYRCKYIRHLAPLFSSLFSPFRPLVLDSNHFPYSLQDSNHPTIQRTPCPYIYQRYHEITMGSQAQAADTTPRIAIIGAGLTGLLVAHGLKKVSSRLIALNQTTTPLTPHADLQEWLPRHRHLRTPPRHRFPAQRLDDRPPLGNAHLSRSPPRRHPR